MSITIDVICYKVKTLKNNEYPLMLRLTKDRQRKYKSIGVSTKLEDWDFSKNQPKPNTPNRDLILELSSKLIGQYRKLVLEFKAEGKDYTLSTLLERVNKAVKTITVGGSSWSIYLLLRHKREVVIQLQCYKYITHLSSTIGI